MLGVELDDKKEHHLIDIKSQLIEFKAQPIERQTQAKTLEIRPLI